MTSLREKQEITNLKMPNYGLGEISSDSDESYKSANEKNDISDSDKSFMSASERVENRVEHNLSNDNENSYYSTSNDSESDDFETSDSDYSESDTSDSDTSDSNTSDTDMDSSDNLLEQVVIDDSIEPLSINTEKKYLISIPTNIALTESDFPSNLRSQIDPAEVEKCFKEKCLVLSIILGV